MRTRPVEGPLAGTRSGQCLLEEPCRHLVVDLPVGVSVFPGELVRTPKVWAQRAYRNLVYFNDDTPAGGHFAAFEQPRLFVEELRAYARLVR
ncbi:hypothetical protein ACF061_24725 [Streptomyces sp. NPDC015220]|uniref:hypothetical protein n=1 Tax=Streptomyces sp. NPDC015220 TaxID=3364947 RepID=UPI0036FF2CA2